MCLFFLCPTLPVQLLSDAGFLDVLADDRSKQFVGILEREIGKAKSDRRELIKVSAMSWVSSAQYKEHALWLNQNARSLHFVQYRSWEC